MTIDTVENNFLVVVFYHGDVHDVTDPSDAVLVRSNASYHSGDIVEFGGGSTPFESFRRLTQDSPHFVGFEIPDGRATTDAWITSPDL